MQQLNTKKTLQKSDKFHKHPRSQRFESKKKLGEMEQSFLSFRLLKSFFWSFISKWRTGNEDTMAERNV